MRIFNKKVSGRTISVETFPSSVKLLREIQHDLFTSTYQGYTQPRRWFAIPNMLVYKLIQRLMVTTIFKEYQPVCVVVVISETDTFWFTQHVCA
jgi:hypothetical protein